jgi:hypothetical protein
MFVPGIRAHTVYAEQRPLIVLERHAAPIDPETIARVRAELGPKGYLLGVQADGSSHPASVGLADDLRRRLHADGFDLSFYKFVEGAPPDEPPHLDTHPDLTAGKALLRLLVNLSAHPRRFLYADDRVLAIPGRTATTLHALRFLASAVPHVGINDLPEHFLLSFETIVDG